MFTTLRTSPFLSPLPCVLALALVTSSTAAGRGPVLADMSLAPAEPAASEPARPAACPAAQEAIAGTSPDKYSTAARHYEACARGGGDAGMWKRAGMARYSARQYAHAIQALDRYLQSAPAGGDPQGEAMLADARKNSATVRFSVVVAPGAALPERLRVMPRGGAAGDEIDLPWSRSAVSFDVWLDPGQWTAELGLPGGGRVGPQDIQATSDAGAPQVVLFRVEAPVSVPLLPAKVILPVEVKVSLGPGAALRKRVKLRWTGPGPDFRMSTRKPVASAKLVPGEYQLHVEAVRFEPQTRVVEVRANEPHSLALTLVRTREDRLRIGLAAGLGGVSLGLLAGGLAGAIGGRRDYRAAPVDGTPSSDNLAATSAALTAIQHSSNGTIVASAGAGTGLAAITVAAGGTRELLGAEIGVGAAVLIAGIAWLVPAKRRYASDALVDQKSWAPDRAYLDEHRTPELAAAALIGLGAGLTAGATLALVARTLVGRSSPRPRAATLTPISAPRAVGLSLQGSF